MKTEKNVLYWGFWKRGVVTTFSFRELIKKKDHSVSRFNEWLKEKEKEMKFHDDKIMLLDFKIVEDK